jgi:hypothetical protein
MSPSHSEEVSGIIFRFINGATPASRDFLSHYERDPGNDSNHSPCKARGLSVLRSYQHCAEMRQGVPALRKKKIAVGELSGGVGLIAGTPSKVCEGHCTWWRGVTAEVVYGLFSTVTEPAIA